MAAPTRKSLDQPDEHLEIQGIVADVVAVADSTISRSVLQPGTHCPQIGVEGRPICMAHHSGYVIDGAMHVQMEDGSTLEIGPHDVFDVPPGHDGVVVGERPLAMLTWAGFRSWSPEGAGERVLVTLLVTDIVGSTERAVELGDAPWREILARHYRAVRDILDRYRGREIATAGDGFLAAFDGAARAIQAAIAVRNRSTADGLSIRAGVHSGEADIVGDDLRGVAVHEAARVAAAAMADEILVSETTRLLAGTAEFTFEPRGPYELKGLPGSRTLFAVDASVSD